MPLCSYLGLPGYAHVCSLLKMAHRHSMGSELIVTVREKRKECSHLKKWHHRWSSSVAYNEMCTCGCCANRSTNGPHLVWKRAQRGLGLGMRGNEDSI